MQLEEMAVLVFKMQIMKFRYVCRRLSDEDSQCDGPVGEGVGR